MGGAVGVRLQRHADGAPRTSVGVTFLYLPNDLVQGADELALRWTAVAITACPPWSLGRTLTAQACGQVIGGWLSATGIGIDHPDSAGRSWWSVGGLLRAGVHLGGGFTLELEVGAAVPLVERRFMITTPEHIAGSTPTVAPVVALGLSLAL
jgi:hypothetical protein